MPELDETLDASASVTEQPENTQAVETEQTTTTTTVPEEEPRLYAGKYKSVEDLENAYKNSTSEASRMSQELRQRSTEPAKPQPTEKQYSVDELESFKEGHLLEVTKAQAAAQRAYEAGDVQKAQELEARALNSARQIRMIDARLRKAEIDSTLSVSKKSAAESRRMKDATSIIQQYRGELVEGTDLHAKASEFMADYQDMGFDINSPLVQAQAVAMAAQVLGLSSKQVAQTTRKELTTSISQALKQGVQTGAGKASKGNAAPNFATMSDQEFIAYKKARGWD